MKIRLSIVVILLLANFAIAQGINSKEPVPDISGTWILDIVKSLTPDERKVVSDYELVIEHRDPILQLTRSYMEAGRRITFTERLSTNKVRDENLNPGGPGFMSDSNKVTNSRSYWKNDILIREFTYRRNLDSVVYVIDRQKFVISKDGKTLTVTSIFRPTEERRQPVDATLRRPLFPVERKMIFRKKI